ncbi:helix-turn-helix transcriptional regulator [Paenibacillus sp. FSL R10-2782]|uniref:helix-turn-helix domain-containing protein n=1 Tax=Paenibacillus sp. FSL R10-2782 TaxID=2954661 RepID=UPI0031594093
MLFNRVKELSEKRGKNIKDVAKELGFSENAFYKWKSQSPKSETIEKVADYFNVSTDYLLGRTDEPNSIPNKVPEWASPKDIRDFKTMLEEDGPIMFDGVPISDEDKDKIKRVMEALFWEAKEMNKKTYGRKKKGE